MASCKLKAADLLPWQGGDLQCGALGFDSAGYEGEKRGKSTLLCQVLEVKQLVINVWG